jgi:hypothetical protein
MESKILKSGILRFNSKLRPFPTLFTFPGIKSSPFWNENNDFLINSKTVRILEENYSLIKQEYLSSIENKNIYLENDYKIIDHEKSLHKGDWEWYSYISKGSKVEKFKNFFPQTFQILESIEDKMLDLPFSYCFLSKLAPNSSISPHYGPCNIRLRLHLGIDIPEGTSITVGEEKRTWTEGKVLAFDDTYLHEVENTNKEKSRTILLLDIWHPDIMQMERNAIRNMFKSAYDKGWIKR